LIAAECSTLSMIDGAACTTVSTSYVAIAFAMAGRRMSRRRNSARPMRRRRSLRGTRESTATTRSISGFAASLATR
jgi:hypothetical protein